MDLRERIYYDPQEKVLMADLSNLQIDTALAKEIFDLEIEIAKTLPEKPYLLVSYKNAKIASDAHEYYAQRLDDLLEVVQDVVRYGVNDFVTRIMLKVENMTRGRRVNIYTSKEAALKAIRSHRV